MQIPSPIKSAIFEKVAQVTWMKLNALFLKLERSLKDIEV